MKLLGGLDRNDFATAFMPLVKYAVVAGDHLAKHSRSDRDFIVGMIRRDKDMVPAYFDFWQFFAKIAWPHVQLPCCQYIEQLGNRPKDLTSVNLVTDGKPLIRAAVV